MPFGFSAVETRKLEASRRSIEDRRDNPVAGRATRFRILQQNMLAYTFPFVPGFAASAAAVNTMAFSEVVQRPLDNAEQEGQLLFGEDFALSPNAVAKVAGDVFEEIEAAIYWNAAAWWNQLMRGDAWPSAPRYAKPSSLPSEKAQVAALSLPRNYDWIRLLDAEAGETVGELREKLSAHDLSLPTSTPDLLIVRLPESLREDEKYVQPLPDLGLPSQETLDRAYRKFEGTLGPSDFLLAIALKKSLRSDRLYQPLYEANNMQLILEERLGGDQFDFEVHTLESAGTAAIETYKAASLANVISGSAPLHRAVRDLYEPPNASDLVRRFFSFLDTRL